MPRRESRKKSYRKQLFPVHLQPNWGNSLFLNMTWLYINFKALERKQHVCGNRFKCSELYKYHDDERLKLHFLPSLNLYFGICSTGLGVIT